MQLQDALKALVRQGFQQTVRVSDGKSVLIKPLGFNSDVQARFDFDNDDVVFSVVVNGMLGDVITSSPADSAKKARRIVADTRALVV